MNLSLWHIYEEGKTVGLEGAEKGRIIKDEEHVYGARITLEEGCEGIPFAITCAIYGLIVHTALAADIMDAVEKYSSMQEEISDILQDDEYKGDTLIGWIEHFVNRYS